MFWPAILAFSLLQFHYYANAQSLQDMAQLFLTTHIVPDILPAFSPSVLLEVSFHTPIIPGQNLTKNATAMAPTLAVQGSTLGSLSEFIVLMVDPDAPSPPNRTSADIRHLLAGDMVLSGSVDMQGFHALVNTTPAITDYAAPNPPSGSSPHRYVLLLYVQPVNFSQQTVVDASTSRVKFNVTQFEAAVGLDAPIGGNMFYVGPALNSSPSTGPNTTSSTPSTKPMAVPTNSSIGGTSGHTSSALALRAGFHFNFIVVLAMYWLASGIMIEERNDSDIK